MLKANLLTGRLAVLTKVSGNLFDQALAALSNVVLAIIVARSVDAAAFGSFSIAYLVYGMAFAAMKAIIGQPLQIRFSSAPPAELNRRMGEGAGATLSLSLLVTVACAVAGLLTGGTTGWAMLLLALWIPALLVQDYCRMAFFAQGRPWSAALIDTVWAVIQFAGLAVLITTERTGLDWLMGAWGVGALVSAVVGLALLRVPPVVRATLSWLREQHDLARYLLAEYILGLGAAQVGILLVGVIAHESAVGALRAAQVLLGPLGILGTAAFQFAVPEIARRMPLTPRRLQIFAALVSGALVAAHLVYVMCLLLIPPAWGVQLFGDSWQGAALVLLPMGLAACFSCLANGPAGVLYGMGKAKQTFRINLIKGPMIVVLLLGATWLWGVLGSAWAFVAIEALILPLWVITLVRVSRQPAEVVADPTQSDLDPEVPRG